MTTSPNVPDPAYNTRSLIYWLPPHGFGNGIHAQAWAILADLTEQQIWDVLLALSEADIAGYVAVERTTPLQSGDPTTAWRLWVDSLQYRHAEDILMEVVRADARRPEEC